MRPKKTKKQLQIEEGIKIVNILYNKFMFELQPFKYLSKEDLEDIKQDAYIKMIETIDRYDESRGTQLSTFITPRIRWFFFDCLRKLSREQKIDTDLKVSLAYEWLKETEGTLDILLNVVQLSNNTSDESLVDLFDSSKGMALIDCLMSLPRDRAYVLLGHYVFDKPIKEISDELGFTIDSGWIYKVKKDSLDYLKKNLTKE
jgi:RNA polymerase sigma factor (sigma-70 family)